MPQNADNPWHRGKTCQEVQMVGSVADERKSGRPKIATDEGMSTQVLAEMARSPTEATRRIFSELENSQNCIMHILRANKQHP